MAKKRKPAEDLTTDEVLERVFPPGVADALRDAVAEKEEPDENSTDDEPSD